MKHYSFKFDDVDGSPFWVYAEAEDEDSALDRVYEILQRDRPFDKIRETSNATQR